MSKPFVPAVPVSAVAQGRAKFDNAVKETLELLTGARSGRIAPLATDASLDEVIAKVNEIIARLQ